MKNTEEQKQQQPNIANNAAETFEYVGHDFQTNTKFGILIAVCDTKKVKIYEPWGLEILNEFNFGETSQLSQICLMNQFFAVYDSESKKIKCLDYLATSTSEAIEWDARSQTAVKAMRSAKNVLAVVYS